MKRLARLSIATAALLALGAKPAMDPVNPTCPLDPGWSTNPQMQFTYFEKDGWKIIKGEGRIDKDVVPRLKAVLAKHPGLIVAHLTTGTLLWSAAVSTALRLSPAPRTAARPRAAEPETSAAPA